MPVTQRNRFLAVSTVLGEDQLLIKSMSLQEQLGRLFQIELDLRSEDRTIKFNDIVGTNATVRLKLPGGQVRYFNGYVSRFVQMQYQGRFAVYHATLVPWLWFLTRTSDCRIFQNKKVPDVIQEIFRVNHFSDYKLKLHGDYALWEYCVQYRETDFNFLSRLMEQEGIYYFFEHQDGKHVLVLADAAAAHEPYPDYDQLTYRPPTTKQEENTETVTDWVIQMEVQPGIYATTDYNPTTPKASLLSNASISREHEHSNYEIFDYPGEFEKRDDGEDYAKLRIQELQAQHQTLQAQATVRGVATGCRFTLKGHPRTDQNRGYLIIGDSIQISAGEYETGNSTQDEFYACSFTAIPANEQFRSSRMTPKPIIQGPQTAIVTGPAGEEIHTDDQARVKVQFHWDRYGKKDQNSSCWIRVSQPWAGKGWGGMSTPRIGQEVIVEFLEGDPDRPIITGRVYNADQAPPYAGGNGVVSGLKSQTHKGQGFNEISMDDTAGKEKLAVIAQYDHSTNVGHDQSNAIGNNRTTTVSVDDSESIGSKQKITVGSDQTLTVGGKQQVSVGASQKNTVGASQTESIGGSRTTNITSSDSMTVGGSQTISVSGALSITSSASIELSVGGSSVKIGPASIDITSSGPINVKGAVVKVNS